MAKQKIIVTDDDPSLQDIFRLILEKAGYHVQVISNGNHIMSGNYELPDLFLLDKQLSGFDGLDICRFLKSQPLIKNIPVVMVSANPGIEQLAKKAGADDAIEKPFEMSAFLLTIKKNLAAAVSIDAAPASEESAQAS